MLYFCGMEKSTEYINQSLRHQYTVREIKFLAMRILQHITQLSTANILTNKYTILSDTQHEKVKMIVERLKKNEPLGYIIGECEFFSLPFEVNPYTLIPRPETEELVDWIITDVRAYCIHPSINKGVYNTPLRILDIGTGSGCIAVSLAKNLKNSIVTAFDISTEALETAKKNAKKNNVTIDFRKEDILEILDKAKRQSRAAGQARNDNANCTDEFDIIVSNPPYVCEKEKTDMKDNVLQYEPHLALFVSGDDPLLFYRAIALFATTHLKQGGSLYFEINRTFGNEICKMLDEMGFFNIELRKDLSGNDRMVKAQRR